MPALADELAGLKGTLHGLSPTNNEPAVYGFACVKSTPVAAIRTALKPGPWDGFFRRPGGSDGAVIKRGPKLTQLASFGLAKMVRD